MFDKFEIIWCHFVPLPSWTMCGLLNQMFKRLDFIKFLKPTYGKQKPSQSSTVLPSRHPSHSGGCDFVPLSLSRSVCSATLFAFVCSTRARAREFVSIPSRRRSRACVFLSYLCYCVVQFVHRSRRVCVSASRSIRRACVSDNTTIKPCAGAPLSHLESPAPIRESQRRPRSGCTYRSGYLHTFHTAAAAAVAAQHSEESKRSVFFLLGGATANRMERKYEK